MRRRQQQRPAPAIGALTRSAVCCVDRCLLSPLLSPSMSKSKVEERPIQLLGRATNNVSIGIVGQSQRGDGWGDECTQSTRERMLTPLSSSSVSMMQECRMVSEARCRSVLSSSALQQRASTAAMLTVCVVACALNSSSRQVDAVQCSVQAER